MEEIEDNTNIIDMKKKFQRFLDESEKKKRKHDDLSESSLFETRDFGSSHNMSGHSSYATESDRLKIKSDLILYKSRNAMLETQLKNKETELKEQRILHETELNTMTVKHEREMRSYQVMKTSHERVLSRQQLCEDELNELRITLQHTKDVYEEKIKLYQKKNLDLDTHHTKALDEQRTKVRELKNQMMRQQTELAIGQSEIAQLQEQLAEKTRKLSDSLTSCTDSEEWKTKAETAEARVLQLENEFQTVKDDILVVNMRKDELAKLQTVLEENKSMKKENAYHRQMTENIAILKEKLSSAEKSLEHQTEQSHKLAKLTVENEALNEKLNELKSKMIPEDTVHRLRESQERELVLTENIGLLKSRNCQLEAEVERMKEASASLQGKLTGGKAKDEKNEKFIERLQRRLILVSKEKDGYKKIIDSYDCDVTREVVSHSTDRLQSVQQNLNSYKKVNEELEKELQSKSNQVISLSTRCAELEQRMADEPCQKSTVMAEQLNQQAVLDLRLKIEQLEKHIETLEHEKQVLETRIEQRNLQGDYDPTKTKVLHFSRNPATLAQSYRAEEISNLRAENQRLKERIKVLESNESVQDVTAQVETNLKNAPVEESQLLIETKSKLTNLELRCERMMEMFKKTSLEFRQVVYQLTGFRVDISKTNEYKLMSMYSGSPEDYLLFQQTPEGEMQLLETDFATTLTDLAEEHLQRQNSIPVFLSHVTMDLFKQQTMTASMIST